MVNIIHQIKFIQRLFYTSIDKSKAIKNNINLSNNNI